jgi:ABC-type spermidine/putrescine transport system permease subunit II
LVDVENIGLLIWFLVQIGLVTCGTVLLVNLFFYRMSFANRIITSMVSGPTVSFLPIFLLGELTISGDWWAALLGFAIVLVLVGVVIFWPVAHFATRRFDRLRENTASVFE